MRLTMRTRGPESCAPSMREVSSASFLRHDLLDDAGGVAADHHIVWHILRDHGSGGNDGIPADGDARTDDGTDADPCILSDGHLPEM